MCINQKTQEEEEKHNPEINTRKTIQKDIKNTCKPKNKTKETITIN